jgi:hypothetical protein
VTGIYSDTTAILDGFTITAGNAESPSCPLSNNYGGGMLNEYGSPTVRNCVFHENRANNVGGGMANRYGSSPTLSNCVFSENAAHHGGGMSNYHASSPLVVDSRFLGNSVSFNGGAVIADGDDVAPSFINCDFRGNSAVGGGGIWGHGHPTLINCTFSGNQAGRGGAVCIGSGGSSVITNCTFSGNSGGAVAGISPAPIEVDNCVFWGNTDSGTGDESAQIEGGVLTIDYSCVQGWTGDLGGTGNFGDDPLLVDADGEDGMAGTEDDDLRLGPASPCIDAGNNEALPPTVITDMDGAPRFVDNALVPDTGFGTPPIIDMGAYEHSLDCNGNGIPDDQDIVGGTSEDCNENLVPDECEAPSDCNDNGVHDGCDIRDGYSYDANGNGIPDECEIPLVTAEGSRYLGVIPADLPCAVALLVTSPDYTCLAKYVDTTGTLTDSPVYHTPSEWGTAHVRGLEIVPNATYTIQTDFGEGVLSGAASATTWQWADTDNNDFINIGDVLLLVQAFTGDFSYVAFEAVDLYPCATDRFINIDDVLQGVVAFQGGTWEDTNCPAPCP